ncbi:MAG: ketoacyl-ACP synthase III [candidate division Zixibacteria bacterium]|nr:ketoacyl-ACP synthase III [candidate division Zixibacteria bacterium]
MEKIETAVRNAVIRGTGHYIPPTVLTNADLERMVDTSNNWIVERTGIRERRILNGDREWGTSDMAVAAARQALADAQMDPSRLEAILVATVTPDFPLPSTASIVQLKLGASRSAVMDVVAACAGFIYALSVARAFIVSGVYRNVLVIGVERLSSITNYQDRNTCVLFGDGAGAAILSRGEPGEEDKGILSTFLSGDGQYKDLLHIPLGGSSVPLTAKNVDQPGRFIYMDGREVFKLAVREMADAAERVLAGAGVSADDVDMLIPHQANQRIIEALGKRMNFGPDRVFVNIDRLGNTSSASVPIALDEARRSGRIGPGSLVLSVAFGGGLTWGAVLYRL